MKYLIIALGSIWISQASELRPVDGRSGEGWNYWWSYLQSKAYPNTLSMSYEHRGAQRIALLKESLTSSTFVAVSALKNSEYFLACYAKTLRGRESKESLDNLPLETGHSLISKELAEALNDTWIEKLKNTRYHLNAGQNAIFDGESCTLGGTSENAPFLYFMGAYNLAENADLKWISEVGDLLIGLIKSKSPDEKSTFASRIMYLLNKNKKGAE